tara:strand:+ start:46 stop:495 length:450 start_codon:yes stop_codon:yes gene_type:complete
MNEEKIKEIIKEIDKTERLNEEAYVGFFYKNDDFLKIDANKKGVVKLISELLKTLVLFDFHLSKEDHFSIIPIKDKNWIDKNSHVVFEYFNPINKVRNNIVKDYNPLDSKSSMKDKLLTIFYSTIFAFFALSFVVGIFNVLAFIIKLFL